VAGQNVRLPRWLVRQHDLLEESGVLVMGVEPGSPAQSAGLEEGDLLIGFDGAAVASIDDLHAQLTDARIGQRVMLDVVRDGEKLHLPIEPADK
jgi:S1-C subfamily serine protease